MYDIVIDLKFISSEILYFYQGSVIFTYNFNIATIANSAKMNEHENLSHKCIVIRS